ncbi:polyprenyl diphosphate synthase [Gracilibacillus alcaliphilus]|uniref:polyprenyl diphosphate synthase n=1 Tax=Gracilibacillus alcaliphilus TaxID=1401441 RepID=UPI00195B6756|nr:polyprenyl diphosphate synthase [Gracilibacillus alcaliphilus]MBM7676219.1 undecaprenyl diphosphate synthase [Gracilibacillus alcaliphilus]
MFYKLTFSIYKMLVHSAFYLSSQHVTGEKACGTIPSHIGIIMDGNGRWAQKRRFPRSIGHYAGMLALRNIIRDCHEIGVNNLTLYAFSSENWRRPAKEVNYLTKELPLEVFNHKIVETYQRDNIRITFLGEIERLPAEITAALKSVEARTADNQGMSVNIALNYGGRKDILQAAKRLIAESSGEDNDYFTEESFSEYLFTRDITDPDLIIRTGGDLRVSNFLLWQASKAELMFVKQYWPSFNTKLLMQSITDYNLRLKKSDI